MAVSKEKNKYTTRPVTLFGIVIRHEVRINRVPVGQVTLDGKIATKVPGAKINGNALKTALRKS